MRAIQPTNKYSTVLQKSQVISIDFCHFSRKFRNFGCRKASRHKRTLFSRHRFAFYCDEWLRLRKSKIRESTYIKYDTILEKHIKPKLGGCYPMGITTGVVDDFTRELLFEDELAVKTAHDILVVLHGVLKHTAA